MTESLSQSKFASARCYAVLHICVSFDASVDVTDARSNRTERARSAAKEPCLDLTNQTRTAGVAPNPVHREFGRTDRRVPCGLAATPL